MGNLSNYYAKTGKKNPFATTSSDTSGGTSQSGGFLRQYQEKNNLATPFEIVKTKPITPVKIVQAPKPVDNIQNRVTSNAAWVGGQVNQNVLQPIANTVKKIGNNITATFVKPQSTMLKDAGIDTAKVEKLMLKPNQKKLAPEQLQKISEPEAMMKKQSKEESLRKAEEIKKVTAQKLANIEKIFDSKKIEPKQLPKGYKEPGVFGDMLDALKEGVVSTIGSIGAGIEMEGRKSKANPYDIQSIASKFLATNIGRKISAEADNILASNPEWAADPKAKLLLDNNLPNPKTVARLGVGAAPSILINIAATLATAPVGGWGGLITGYLMEGGSTYKEAKKMGVPEEKAQFYGTTVGVVNSIFEHLMPFSATMGGKIFKQGAKEVSKEAVEQVSKSFAKEAIKQAKNYGINILKNGAIEGSTEGIQEFWSNVIATNYDKNRKVWDNIIESMVGGFVGGGVAGGSTESAVDNNIIVIPDGEHTPQAVIGQVISNGQENTVEGKELIKTAVEAQQKGQNVLIETTKQGEVNSEVKTINQEETKVEKPKVEYTDGAIKKLQDQIDKILNIDPNIKNFKQRQKEWGISFQATDQAAEAGDIQAQEDIRKIVELQGQIEDMRDARQAYLKSKKTKKSAKEYVESKVKERSVKFRQKEQVLSEEEKNIIAEQGAEVKALLEDEKIMAKITNEKTNPRFFMDDTVALEDIKKRIDTNKATQKDIDTALEILETAGYGPKFIKTYFHFADYQAKKASGELGAYVSKKGPKFREDTTKPLTIEDIKAQNAVAKQESAKTGQEVAEDIAEKAMGWKSGDQKREFDAAMSRKDAAKVREMLPSVPEYFKTEFKQEIDEVLDNDFTEEAKILRGTKGMTADDIMKTYPNIQLKKDVPATDIYGNKKIIPEGEKLTPYDLKGNKVLLQDGETYIVTKNQFQNIKGQSKTAEGKPFAPELEGLEETVMGIGETNGEIAKKMFNKEWNTLSEEEKQEVTNYMRQSDAPSMKQTKYSQYTLPGGENYKEILIKAPTLPENYARYANADKLAMAKYGKTMRELWDSNEMDKWNEISKENTTKYDNHFKSSHWDEPNIIAHLRMNEREYNGQKVAFMEELQSDWAREGRSKGFKMDDPSSEIKEANELFKKYGWTKEMIPTDPNDYSAALDELSDKLYEQGLKGGAEQERIGILSKSIYEKTLGANMAGKVPFNENLKNWQELTIKRALKEAVNSDAEYFAWINGDQTSNRYNLATHVKDVVWYFADGYKIIKLQPKQMADRIEFGIDAEGVIRQVEEARYVDWKGKKLDEVLGKGLADKIMADEKGTLSGEGLRFGGEWANTLYDKQVKNIVEDLTGGKVETIDMGLSADEKVKRFLYNGSQGADIMAGDRVTPETIKVGQLIYKAGKSTNYIITEVLGKGKFKAISTSELFDMSGDERAQYISDLRNPGQYEKRLLQKNGEDSKDWINKQLENRKRFLNENSETFDITQTTTKQQALKLTPEIKARIKGEALQIETSGKMFEDAKFRVKDDVKRMTGRTITDAQEQELIDLNRKFMGDDKVSIVLQIMANEKALGKYQDGMIEILDGQMDPKATLMHEIGHKYLDAFSTTEEYVAVLEEGAKKYKTDDFVEVEEQVVERLNEVAKEWDTFNKSVENLDPITKFLVKVIRRIKIYFANKSAINRLYNDILEGKAAKKATKTAQETAPGLKTEIPTNEQAQTPVGEGDKTKSKAYTRVYDRLAEEAQQDVSYNKLNLEKDTQNALEFITKDPKAAIRVGLGLEEAPAGQTETAISIALADKAGRDGDFALQSQLEASRSLRQTRRGQEIVSERGRFNEDSPHFFIRELMDMRLKNLGSNLKSSLEELQGKVKSVKKAALEKIDKGVSKLKEKIKADRKKIALAQDIIDSIIC